MHTLVGCYLQELPELPLDDPELPHLSSVFPLKIIIPPAKSRMLFFPSHSEQLKWLSLFRAQMAHSPLIQEHYVFGEVLGHGQFGEVRMGTSVRSGRQVAIKVVRKRDMKPIEVYQQRREIDVLKVC